MDAYQTSKDIQKPLSHLFEPSYNYRLEGKNSSGYYPYFTHYKLRKKYNK